MTQARARAHGVVTPSLSQLSLTATLCVLVRLVLGLASTLQMILNRRPRDWHTRATHEALPRETSEISETGTNIGPSGSRPAVDAQRRTATLHDHAFTSGSVFREHALPAKAGIQSARTARFQQGTALSPLIPTNVRIQGRSRTLSKPAASIPRTRQDRSWIPTFVGMSGCCRGQLRAPA